METTILKNTCEHHLMNEANKRHEELSEDNVVVFCSKFFDPIDEKHTFIIAHH